jgi:polysaccharide biosynthesis protein PslG
VATAGQRIAGPLRAWTAAFALAVVALAAAATPALALPSDFWGVVPQGTPSAEQLQRLRLGGVESVRIPIQWAGVQPSGPGAFDWSAVDAQVGAAAQAGLDVLPFVFSAPSWAVRSEFVPGSHRTVKAPHNLPASGRAAAAWKAFLAAAVARYGPNGAFWAENPSLPKRPIGAWQIWNEENFKYFVAHPNPVQYGKLVKISSAAIKGADPSAKVVLGGMFARPKGSRNPKTGKHKSLNWFASDFLEAMLKRTPRIGARFDGIALHPYSYYYWELPGEIEEARAVLKRGHDAGESLWITELGWSSEHPSRSDLFAKGPGGQAAQLRGAFRLLRAKHAKWRLRGVYWFSVDDQAGACNFCGGSGLFGPGFVPKPAWSAYVSFAGGTP